jgi:hypothetical protein
MPGIIMPGIIMPGIIMPGIIMPGIILTTDVGRGQTGDGRWAVNLQSPVLRLVPVFFRVPVFNVAIILKPRREAFTIEVCLILK